MPQLFKIAGYWVYFWVNENEPLEPVHVHISEGKPTSNATKVWITASGKCYLSHNNSGIPRHILNRLMRVIEARSNEIIQVWSDYFGEITYFC